MTNDRVELKTQNDYDTEQTVCPSTHIHSSEYYYYYSVFKVISFASLFYGHIFVVIRIRVVADLTSSKQKNLNGFQTPSEKSMIIIIIPVVYYILSIRLRQLFFENALCAKTVKTLLRSRAIDRFGSRACAGFSSTRRGNSFSENAAKLPTVFRRRHVNKDHGESTCHRNNKTNKVHLYDIVFCEQYRQLSDEFYTVVSCKITRHVDVFCPAE